MQRLQDKFGIDVSPIHLSLRQIEIWRDWLAKEAPRKDGRPGNLSPKSVKEHIDWLASIFNQSGLHNPCRGVERPARTHTEESEALKFFTPEEMATLFRVCREQLPEFYNGLVFLSYTGCRADELRGLRETDIDRAAQTVKVTGKGSKRRSLKLTGSLAPAWNAVLAEIDAGLKGRGRGLKKGPAIYVFKQFSRWSGRRMDELCKIAFDGTKHGHPHMLRHTLATMALLHFKPTWDIAFLAKWLGHADISVTYRIYGHLIAKEPPSAYSLEGPKAPEAAATEPLQADRTAEIIEIYGG